MVDSTKRKYFGDVIKLNYLFKPMKIFQNYSLITKIGAIAVSLAFPLATIESAQAVIFVENLSEPLVAPAGTLSTSPFASSFTTDNNSYTLNSVIASLNEGIESTLSINLHTDNGGEPGTIIEQLNTTENILPGPLNNYLFTPSSTVNLNANTTYWLSSFVVNPGNYGWGVTNSPNQTSPGAWTIGDESVFSSDGGTSWTSFPGFVSQFNVDADIASTAVPFEFSPTMGILLISGLFGLKVVYGRFQANKVKVEN